MTRTFHFLITAITLAATLPAVAQQQQPHPAEVALKRMRESLRTTMIQLQTAEADKATLQATLDTTKAETDKKIKTLTKDLDDLRKKSTAERNEADKSILDLSAKVANLEQDLSRTKETLAKWKEGYAKAAAISVKKESERAALAAKVVILDRRVEDNEVKNAEMFKIANEVLDRFKGFGLGTALTAREPFTGLMRVKLQNLMQSYQDKLIAQKIRPTDYNSTTPESQPPAAEKPAADAKPGAIQKPTTTTAKSAAPAAAKAEPAQTKTTEPKAKP